MTSSHPTSYFLYARKSTESEDRQTLSIESQIAELKRIADREGLVIVEVLQESRSAKTLGRPVFNTMLERIQRGDANGILCWKLDRLARNFIDGGKIMEMLQSGVIQHIRAFERAYEPRDNVLLMAVEFGMANQFSRDLAVNVARGMRRKAELGWYPVQPPLGYLNTKTSNKGSNIIINDPERFDLVRRMWDTMLTGAYTPPKILQMATEEWGLRSRQGLKLSTSNIYFLLTNPFYYGRFQWGDVWHQGAHEPMITAEEYDRVQVLLGRKGRPRPKSYNFAFTGTMHCAECGKAITAEEKIKTQQNGNTHRYRYYHCTKKGGADKCTQKCVEEKRIIAQGMDKLEKLVVPEPFHQWALKWLKQENKKEIQGRNAILSAQRKAYDAVVTKIDRYLDMRAAGEMTEEEYSQKREAALREKSRLIELLNDTDGRVTRWSENMSYAFEFIEQAKQRFEHSSPEQKRAILLALGAAGSNLLLKDKTVLIDTEKTLLPMQSLAEKVQAIHERLEPPKNAMAQADLERCYSENPTVSARLYAARNVFMQEPTPAYVALVKLWRVQ
ncbi:site-specific DNA recombinase [Azospirillaceae bacterium]